MRRIGRIIVALFTGATLLAVLALALLLTTPTGARWLIERAIAQSNGAVEATGIDGTLWSGIRVNDMQIHAGDVLVEVAALEIVPAWAASLADGAIIIDRFAAGSVRVKTSDERRPLAVELPPLPIQVDLRAVRVDRIDFNGMPDPPALQARISFDGARYSVRDLALRANGYEVGGDVELTAAPDVPLSGSLAWRLTDPELTDPKLTGHVELADSLRELGIVVRLEKPFVADARGRVRLLGEIDPHFDVEASVAAWSDETLRITDATLLIAGTLGKFDAHGAGTVNMRDLPKAQLAARANGSLDALDIEQLTLTTEHGRAIARGRIERAPELGVDLAVDVEDLDPAVFVTAISGAVSGHATLHTRNEDLNIAVESMAGELNGAAFQATGQISRLDGLWAAQGVDIRSGPNHATVALDWHDDQVHGAIQLNMPNLGILVPQLGGDVNGTIKFSGARDKPNLDATIEAKALRYQEWSATDLRVDATAKEGRAGQARLTAASMSRDELRLDRVELAARGTLDAIDATLGWTFGDQRGSMGLSGRRDAKRWDVEIAEGALLTVPGESWRLDRRLRAKIADGAFSVSAHCWLHPGGAGRVCVETAAGHAGEMQLVGTIDAVPIAALANRFDALGRLAGTVSGRWDLASDARGWHGVTAFDTDHFGLVDDSDGDDAHLLELPKLTATANVANDRTVLSVVAMNAQSRVLSVDLDIGGFAATAPIRGHATVAIEDLAFIATFSRRIGEISGALDGALEIGGTLTAPSVSGAISTKIPRMVLTEPHIEFDDVEIGFQLADLDRIDIRATARSDDGRVTIDGALFSPFAETRRLQARVDADRLRVRIPDLDARVGGRVDLEWRAGLTTVKGRVDIPKAAITITELPPGAVAVSNDVIVINRLERAPEGMRMQVDLELDLQHDVRFTAFGLSTGLAGTLRLRQSVAGVVQLTGSLALVDGTFTAFRQTLAIDSGRLTYNGPPDNPFVDARASRTIQEPSRTVTVGAHIQGPARSIETTLFSDPTMSEADTLAYLVLGRPLSSANAEESNNVMGAAIALGLEGASPIINQIRNTFGLEELTATGGSTEDLTVIAGRRFNNRVFVRYSYQTFTRMSAILIELTLNRRLVLETTASQIPAVDLIYRVRENN